MAGMGPPPKPDGQRRRRNATISMTRLPARGRSGEPPRWPLRPDVSLTIELGLAQDDRLALEGAMEAGDAPRNAAAKLARLDQRIAELEAKIAAAAEMESELWVDLWRTPQAVQWERLAWTREVAQYVRWKIRAEFGDLDASKEARQLADRLGLSPLAMLRLRWEVAPDELAEARAEKASARPAKSARQRLRVVDSGGVAGA